jgi:hypothetical protein|nr:MAG TPA: hypothetical protein [Bacteriophage sp.]
MEKVIAKHLSITSANRGIEKLDHEIYSHDKGTAVFKFTTDELTASKVLCLFYFKETKRYRTVEAVISENTITIPFDSSSIITDEPVMGYIYFEKVEQSTDVYAFAFNVWVSAIDKAKKAPLVEQVSGRIVDVENIVTKQELDELFAKIKVQGGTYDDSSLRTELENKVNRTEFTQITGKVEALEHKMDKYTVYDDEPVKRRLTALESKPEVDNSTLVTKQELESKGYLTQHQSLTEYAKKTELPQPYNDTELKSRVARLESKPEVDTSGLVTKQELAGKGYLTEHQPLTEYAKKSELPQPYNDTEVKSRIQTLETKTETLATKEELNRVGIPQKLSITGNVVTLSDGGGSITLPATATPTPSGTAQANEYEIHGTGFPNGKVTAPVGTTYVDTAVTNGALKWIKRKGDNNQGWEVLVGDTGWKRLSISSGYNQSTLRVRRINNTITYKLDGLSQDRFGIVRRGGPGYLSHASDTERNVYLLYNNRIPIGYRSAMSLSGQIFDGTGNPYGSWFLGGINNGNYFMFHFAEPVSTENNITDIIVSNVSYITDDPWPTV